MLSVFSYSRHLQFHSNRHFRLHRLLLRWDRLELHIDQRDGDRTFSIRLLHRCQSVQSHDHDRLVNNFTGSVSLSASAPAGLTASINPTSVNMASGGTATSVLTITATSSTPTGSYNVTVTGTSGSQTHSILVTVNVVNQDFTISESPTSQAIPLGSEQQTVLDLYSVNGFSGNVNLVATPSSNAIACWFTYTLTSTATLYI